MRSQLLPTIFKAPSTTRSKFDAICRLGGRTRTSVLVELMNDYILAVGPVVLARAAAVDHVIIPPVEPNPIEAMAFALPLPLWSDGCPNEVEIF